MGVMAIGCRTLSDFQYEQSRLMTPQQMRAKRAWKAFITRTERRSGWLDDDAPGAPFVVDQDEVFDCERPLTVEPDDDTDAFAWTSEDDGPDPDSIEYGSVLELAYNSEEFVINDGFTITSGDFYRAHERQQ